MYFFTRKIVFVYPLQIYLDIADTVCMCACVRACVCVCSCVGVCANDSLKTSEGKWMQHALCAVSPLLTQLLAAWQTPSPGWRGVHPLLASCNVLQAEQLPAAPPRPHHRCSASPSSRVGLVWLKPGDAAQTRHRPHTHTHTHTTMTWSGSGSQAWHSLV